MILFCSQQRYNGVITQLSGHAGQSQLVLASHATTNTHQMTPFFKYKYFIDTGKGRHLFGFLSFLVFCVLVRFGLPRPVLRALEQRQQTRLPALPCLALQHLHPLPAHQVSVSQSEHQSVRPIPQVCQ